MMIKLDTTKVFSLVGPVFSGLAVLILLGALIGVIFFTALDWQWVAFLSGILFASVMSLVVRASRVEWRAARRTGQLQRFRDRLNEEAQRAATLQKDLEEEHRRHESYRDRLTQELTAHERDSRAMKSVEGMLVLIADSLPSLIMYADRGLICRF